MQIEIVTAPNLACKETGFGPIQSCDGILTSIRLAGHSVKVSLCQTQYDLERIVNRGPDLVVLCVKYLAIKGQDNLWLSDFFRSYDVNYTGSHREELRFDSDKISAKSHLGYYNIKTSRYFTALPGEYENENEFPFLFPFFIKPSDAANGNGIDDLSYVLNLKDYKRKVLSLYSLYKQPVLIEQYLSGREFTAAIIEDANNHLLVAAIEIVAPVSSKGVRVLGAKTKRDNTEVLMKIFDVDLIAKVKEMATEVFKRLRVRDFCRIDIKLNENDDCCFMEANLIPGMVDGTSYFPRAFSIDLGLTYDEVIKLVIQQGIRRASAF